MPKLEKYRIASVCCAYGGVQQRWFVVESQERKQAEQRSLSNPPIFQLHLSALLLALLKTELNPLVPVERAKGGIYSWMQHIMLEHYAMFKYNLSPFQPMH